MADILLAHCNHLYFDRKQVRKMQPYPPLQTLLCGLPARKGYDVALFDCTLAYSEEAFREALERHRPRLVALCEDNFNFLTKMCLTRNRDLAYSMCRSAKERGLPVVVNSSDASDHVADYLRNGADFVILGEVEATLLEAAHHVCCARRVSAAARDRGTGLSRSQLTRTPRINPPRPPIEDLDSLPQPAWDLVDAEPYRRAWVVAHSYFSMNIVSSRGCPYRCNWCSKPIHGSAYHCRSPRSVAEEMRRLKLEFRPDHIWFADDIFALSAQWTQEFAKAVEAADAKIPFKMQSRCDLMTLGAVEALRDAGCVEVWMGAESGSQNVLNAMEKGLRVEETYAACGRLQANEIRAGLFLQFGYPGETWDDIQSTIQMVRRVRPDDIGVSVAYPLPGTKFYDLVGAQLGVKKNWDDSDDLAMMFQGSYRSEFYRALRDALHAEVSGSGGPALSELWRNVEALERTHAAPNPTPLWTSC